MQPVAGVLLLGFVAMALAIGQPVVVPPESYSVTVRDGMGTYAYVDVDRVLQRQAFEYHQQGARPAQVYDHFDKNVTYVVTWLFGCVYAVTPEERRGSYRASVPEDVKWQRSERLNNETCNVWWRPNEDGKDEFYWTSTTTPNLLLQKSVSRSMVYFDEWNVGHVDPRNLDPPDNCHPWSKDTFGLSFSQFLLKLGF